MSQSPINATPNITPTFTDAAGGPESGADPVESGGPHTLNGGAAERIEATEDLERADTAPAEDAAQAAPTTADSEPAETPSEDRADPVAQAQAELEQLEAGRPTPQPRNDFQPPRKLIQIVHTEVERKRENRIAALKAYLDDRPDPTNTPESTPDDFPEPAF